MEMFFFSKKYSFYNSLHLEGKQKNKPNQSSANLNLK